MKRILRVACVVMFVLSAATVLGSHSLAAEKEPVRFEVLNTFRTDLPGIEKAQLIQFEMDPGA